ncbi:MAG: serine/threonine-protein kinase [Planctomycetota bacterium]|nr:serine/threonine-protein kinase [Planctomycetota bacterium]
MLLPGYTLGARLGLGARSVIYLVTKNNSGEKFALKQVQREGPQDDRFIEQAENEFRVSSRVIHPAIRRSYEIKRIRKWFQLRYLLILMEYVPARTMEEDRPTDIDRILDLFMKVADGLDALHKQNIVHADIKPNNILVLPDGNVKVIDFGQSCPVGHVKSRIQGTPDYIAPEQAHRRPIDQRTDVFNLGATLYWVTTGRAFPTVLPSPTRQRGMDIARPKDAKLPHEYNPDVPVALSNLIMDCCKTPPKERPSDMRQVRARLDLIRRLLERERAEAEGVGGDNPEAPRSAADSTP